MAIDFELCDLFSRRETYLGNKETGAANESESEFKLS
jgi:hypothetical protein